MDLPHSRVPRGLLMGEILRRLSDARLDAEVRSRAEEEYIVVDALDGLDGEPGEDRRELDGS